jgi:hypothetical protein
VPDERRGQVPAAGTGRDPDGARGRVDLDRRIRRVLTSYPVGRTPMPWPVAWTPTESPASVAVRAPTTSRGRW